MKPKTCKECQVIQKTMLDSVTIEKQQKTKDIEINWKCSSCGAIWKLAFHYKFMGRK